LGISRKHARSPWAACDEGRTPIVFLGQAVALAVHQTTAKSFDSRTIVENESGAARSQLVGDRDQP